MAKVKVVFSSILASVVGKEREIYVQATNLREVLDVLVSRYGEAFKERLFDHNGNLRRFVHVYVNGRDSYFLQGLGTRLEEGDEVAILPAVSGG